MILFTRASRAAHFFFDSTPKVFMKGQKTVRFFPAREYDEPFSNLHCFESNFITPDY